jgi:2-polyprenyl-3-methyl-5-hydroxy-6-metoxy-1,4-benzoquinol methylase
MTACPLCGSANARVIWTCTADEAAQQWAIAEQEPARHAELSAEIASLWHGDSAASRECVECGFGFADPFVAGSPRFYTLAFGPSGYPRDKWEFRRTRQALAEHDCRTWDVLEIGAGGGFFLDSLDDLGIPPEHRYGSEYNATSIAAMRKKGYRIEPLEIEQLASLGKTFDAIFMFQVLEHRDRIDVVFETIRSLLKEGGLLFVAVPNSERTRFNEKNGSLLDLPPNHIGQWTVGNFEQAAKRFGYKLLAVETEPFDAVRFVKQDMIFSFMRKAQQRGTVANYLYPRRKKAVGRAAVAAAVGVNALRRAPFWIRKRKEVSNIGENIWAQMQRI